MSEMKFKEKKLEPIGEEFSFEFNGQKVPALKFRVTDSDGRVREQVGMTYQSVAAVLEYGDRRAVSKLVQRNIDEFAADLFNPNEIQERRTDSPQKTYSQAIYLVGSGLDLLLMKSRQTIAKEFRKWLKVRSQELRTKGIALANGRVDDIKPQDLSADLSHLSPSLARLQAVMQSMNGLFLETVKAAEERHQLTVKTEALEDRSYKLEDRLDAIDRWRQSNDIKLGEKTFTMAAEDHRIMCHSTQGKTPNPGAIRLLCINAEFDRRGLLRDRVIHVESKGPLNSQVLTQKGVRVFVHEILPSIPFGRSRVEPNKYTKKRYGSRNGFNIIRLRHTDTIS